MKKYDVFGIGNALVDCVILVTEKFLEDNSIEKGVMTLVAVSYTHLTLPTILLV